MVAKAPLKSYPHYPPAKYIGSDWFFSSKWNVFKAGLLNYSVVFCAAEVSKISAEMINFCCSELKESVTPSIHLLRASTP
jgi:hypothetical protein